MSCLLCGSQDQLEFAAETNVCFGSGIKNIHVPGFLMFPKILFCLKCGFSRFTLPEIELAEFRLKIAALKSTGST